MMKPYSNKWKLTKKLKLHLDQHTRPLKKKERSAKLSKLQNIS